jgi:WD40 repeat protein
MGARDRRRGRDEETPRGPGPASGSPGEIEDARSFARELTRTREAAWLSVRDVAKALDLPVSTVGGWYGGRHLPPVRQAQLLTELLRVCGVTDPEAVTRWHDALARVRRAERPQRRTASGPPPYRGLESFRVADARWFFGREALTARLLAMVGACRRSGGGLVVVVGPSGSGKSSLLHAGLLATLAAAEGGAPQSGDEPPATAPGAPYVSTTPGSAPLDRLAHAVAGLAGADPDETAAAFRTDPAAVPAHRPGGPETGTEENGTAQNGEGVLVVDQFEEVFTVCDDPEERAAFLTGLEALCRSKRTTVVVSLRADFYGEAARVPLLAEALENRQLLVTPMTRDQLRQAIAEPARAAGAALEEGLVELLLRDLAPLGGARGAGHDVGALPLLSYALLATWVRAGGRELTVADYLAVGGLDGAVATSAETVFGGLTPTERTATRRMFLRMVHVGHGTAETRRRVERRELGPDEAVLRPFVERRLVTADTTTVEITHEALLGAWPRLRGWIDADRAGLRILRRLTESADAWVESGHDPAALHRGAWLEIAAEWAADPGHRAALTPTETAFLDASVAHAEAERAAVRRRARQSRRLLALLSVLLLLSGGLTGYAFEQRDGARTQRLLAVSREVAVEADRIRTADAPLAAQLALAAYRVAPTTEARGALLDSTAGPLATRVLGFRDVVQATALTPGRTTLAAAGADGTVRLWDVSHPGRPVPLGPPLEHLSSAVFALAVSPDGGTLAAGGADGRVRLFRITDPRHPTALGAAPAGARATVYSLAFSPDGHTLAAGTADDSVHLWNVADPSRPRSARAPLTGARGFVQAVAYSPDGRTLAAGSADGTVRLWSTGHPAAPRTLTGAHATVGAVAFTRDGGTLAEGSRDGTLRLWNVTDPAHPRADGGPLTVSTSWTNALAFGPGGLLAVGTSDDTLQVWDTRTRTRELTLHHPGPVTTVSWDGAGRLVTGCADDVLRVWHLPTPVLPADGTVNSAAFTPGGRVLAVGAGDLRLWSPATREPIGAPLPHPGSAVTFVTVRPAAGGAARVLAAGYTDGTVGLWNITDPAHPRRVGPFLRASATGYPESLAFSADGRYLASGGDDDTVRLWDLADPGAPRALARLTQPHSYVFSVAFSPDGRTLAAGSADHTVRLWDLAAPARPRALRALTGAANTVYAVAFSPDGRTLAAGSADRTVRLWNVTDPARPTPIGTPLTGPANFVYALAFSPDGHTLAAASTDTTVWLWNVRDPAAPRPLATLTGPGDHLYTVAFDPADGRTLAAGGADATVRLWDTGPGPAAATVCAATGAPLTRAEWHQYVPSLPYRAPCPG